MFEQVSFSGSHFPLLAPAPWLLLQRSGYSECFLLRVLSGGQRPPSASASANGHLVQRTDDHSDHKRFAAKQKKG